MRNSLSASIALATLATSAFADNSTQPANNTSITIKMGKTASIQVSASGGCSFDVAAVSSDDLVVTVPPSSLQQTSHAIVITPAGPGTATITLTTANGSNATCEGATFTFPVTVTPNLVALGLNAKVKYAIAGKELKTAFLLIHFGTDLVYAQLGDDVEAGLLAPTDALESGLEATADAINSMTIATQQTLQATMDEMSTRGATYGYDATSMPKTLLPGGCGGWDKFEDLVALGSLKALGGLEKKLKLRALQFDKLVKELGHDGIVLMLPSPTISLSPPQVILAPPAPPAAPSQPLRVTWSASGRLTEDANSRVVVAGLADPAGGDVTVTVTGPNGFNQVVVATVDVYFRWRGVLADVPPGSYAISAVQGTSDPETRTHQVL